MCGRLIPFEGRRARRDIALRQWRAHDFVPALTRRAADLDPSRRARTGSGSSWLEVPTWRRGEGRGRVEEAGVRHETASVGPRDPTSSMTTARTSAACGWMRSSSPRGPLGALHGVAAAHPTCGPASAVEPHERRGGLDADPVRSADAPASGGSAGLDNPRNAGTSARISRVSCGRSRPSTRYARRSKISAQLSSSPHRARVRVEGLLKSARGSRRTLQHRRRFPEASRGGQGDEQRTNHDVGWRVLLRTECPPRPRADAFADLEGVNNLFVRAQLRDAIGEGWSPAPRSSWPA